MRAAIQAPEVPPEAIVADSSVQDSPRHVRLTKIYKSEVRFVWRSLRRLGVNHADVEDAAQDVFIVIDRRLRSFDETRSLRSWVFGIVMRVASEYRRRVGRRRETFDAPDAEQSVPATQEAQLEQARAQALLSRAMEELTEPQRATFMLFELEQLTMREVSELLNCPLQTGYTRLRAAHARIEAALERLNNG